MNTAAIASPHALATEAGRDAFAAGGNAIDAALAAASVLTVVYPHQCAIGGDLFALVHKGDGQTYSINGSGALPNAVDIEALRTDYPDVPPNGPLSITVPGMVAGWDSIAGLGGTLTPGEVLAPAIELAANGVEVSSSLASGIEAQADVLKLDEGMKALFLPSGVPLEEGAVIRQPALAETLESLVDEGLDGFYRGRVGQQLVKGLADLGTKISEEDLSSHRSETSPPLSYRHGDIELMTSPPNSQGFLLLETLAALDALNITFDPLGESARHGLYALLLAAHDRDACLGDPSHTQIPLDYLLDGNELKERLKKLMETGVHSLSHNITTPAHGDTVAICTMDNDGNAVSLIQSVYQTFGAGIMERQTGIIMHNRARGFSLKSGTPNEMISGMRPAHTLMPLLVCNDGGVVASLGTMGGKAQPQILMQILSGVLDPDTTVSEILSAPRWVFGSRDIGFDNLTVAIEADAPGELDGILNVDGLDLARVNPRDERMGHANVVRLLADDVLESASDPRSNGLGITCNH